MIWIWWVEDATKSKTWNKLEHFVIHVVLRPFYSRTIFRGRHKKELFVKAPQAPKGGADFFQTPVFDLISVTHRTQPNNIEPWKFTFRTRLTFSTPKLISFHWEFPQFNTSCYSLIKSNWNWTSPAEQTLF